MRTCAPPAPRTRSLSQNENWKGRRGRSGGGVCRPLRRLIRGCCAFCCARLPVHSTRAGPSPSAAFSRRPPRAALSQRADPPSCRRPRRRRTRPHRRRKQRAPSRRRRACSQNRNSVKKGALHTHRTLATGALDDRVARAELLNQQGTERRRLACSQLSMCASTTPWCRQAPSGRCLAERCVRVSPHHATAVLRLGEERLPRYS